MAPQLFGNTPRCTRQAQEKRGQHPVHHRALAAIQERAREVIDGALAALLFTAVALQARLGVIGAPGTDVEALTAGTLEGPIFPAQRMEVGLTRFGVEEVVEMRHNRHGCVSPLITRSVKNRIGDSQLTIEFLDRYKPLEIEREWVANFDFRILDAPTKRESEALEKAVLSDLALSKLFEQYVEEFEQRKRAN